MSLRAFEKLALLDAGLESRVNRAIVVGGGFAGVAAACRLAEEGHRTLLLERSSHLGGRASSFVDREMEETIDYGHHVSMACCTASRGFLARVGSSDAVRFQRELRIPLLCDEKPTILRSSLLPGPLHLAPSLLRYRPLSLRDRISVLRAGLALLVRRSSADENLGAWLGQQGQSEQAVARLWNPITIATLNAPVDRVNTSAARQVFREAFFVPGGANMGLFTCPLSEIFERARASLERQEGELRTQATVARVTVEDGAVHGVALVNGETIEADAVVIAVPQDAAAELLANHSELSEVSDAAAGLDSSSIVDVHLWFDRPVMKEAFVIAVDAPIQTVFDLAQIHRTEASGSHLVVSQSAADDWMNRSSEEIARLTQDALRDLLPAARRSTCLRTRVIKHPRATFVPTPGSDALRPKARTPIDGLFLAGDWIATGWPSTIEGAIRSGVAAAAHVEQFYELRDDCLEARRL